jgi:hypothetical protein
VKKKAARRKTASAAPHVDSLPPYDPDKLYRLMYERVQSRDDSAKDRYMLTPRTTIAGVPLPVNLDEIAESIGRDEVEFWKAWMDMLRITVPAEEIGHVQGFVADAVRKGFVLALLRYADELKHVPEARAMIDAHRQISKKGGDARRKEAEPRRQQARRLDRELRKEGGLMKKKTHRVERIAREMKRDTRTIERYLDPKRDKK